MESILNTSLKSEEKIYTTLPYLGPDYVHYYVLSSPTDLVLSQIKISLAFMLVQFTLHNYRST